MFVEGLDCLLHPIHSPSNIPSEVSRTISRNTNLILADTFETSALISGSESFVSISAKFSSLSSASRCCQVGASYALLDATHQKTES